MLLFFIIIMKKLIIYAFLVWLWVVLWRVEFSLPSLSLGIQKNVEAEAPTITAVAIYKKQLICTAVCNWNQDLVDYAREKTKDMEIITTITDESKWDRKAKGEWTEEWLCQWTDTRLDFKQSLEFNNPYRQIDKCWEQFQQRRADWVVGFQLKWYNKRHLREKYFELKDVFVGIEYK